MLRLVVLAVSLLSATLCVLAYSTPPSGAITVGSGGTYSTLSAALKDTSSSVYFIYAGSYKDTVIITRSVKVCDTFHTTLATITDLECASRYTGRPTRLFHTRETVRHDARVLYRMKLLTVVRAQLSRSPTVRGAILFPSYHPLTHLRSRYSCVLGWLK